MVICLFLHITKVGDKNQVGTKLKNYLEVIPNLFSICEKAILRIKHKNTRIKKNIWCTHFTSPFLRLKKTKRLYCSATI
jgi:hypothetical protein